MVVRAALVAAVAAAAVALPSAATSRGTGPVGVLGCSNIRLSVEGYHTLGGTRIWNLGYAYAAGTVVNWWEPYGSAGKYWRQFRTLFAANPGTRTFWWGLCIYASESDTETWAAAVANLAYLRAYLASQGVVSPTVYVSAMNGFVAPHCASEASTGCAGPQRARNLRDRILTDPATAGADLAAGPVLEDLLAYNCVPSAGATAANNEVLDGGGDCVHPNSKGELRLGGDLLAFFG